MDAARSVASMALSSPDGQVSRMTGEVLSAAGPFGAGAPSRRPPEGLSHSSRGQVLAVLSRPATGAPWRQRDRAAPGRRDGARAPQLGDPSKINATLLSHKMTTDDHEERSIVVVRGREVRRSWRVLAGIGRRWGRPPTIRQVVSGALAGGSAALCLPRSPGPSRPRPCIA